MTKCSCGEELELSRKIVEPDRFEFYLGVEETHREWWSCPTCGHAEQRYLISGLEERLESICENYFEIDFPNLTVRKRFNSIRSLPPEDSDNRSRIERVANFIEDSFRGIQFSSADIGAGVGVFPLALRESLGQKISRLDVYEVDLVCREFLSELRVFDNVYSTFPQRSTSERYDLITINNVIEHLKNPTSLLSDAVASLTPRGMLYVEVPSALSVRRVSEGDNSIGALHYRLYSAGSLRDLLKLVGMQALEIVKLRTPSGKYTICGFFAQFGANDKVGSGSL